VTGRFSADDPHGNGRKRQWYDPAMPDPKPWNPTKGTRILIGIATLWPPVYFFLFLASIGFVFTSASANKQGFPDIFKVIFPLHCFTMLLSFALMAVYVVHAFRNSRFTQEMRILWVIILFMGNMFAFPVYWWLYLRPSGPDAGSTPASGSTLS
jgi:threonine/homoserine/homoserine lactone efflux protein